MDQTFVAYYRVSTDKQGQSGVGMDAQRSAVEQHAKSVGGEVVAEFRDVESGRKADRSGLDAALAECRAMRATLLIAKLDRLARSVAFIANLMEGRVDFVVADMPGVNRLTVHVLAAVAEHEREMISQRAKAALAVAKGRGTRLGNPACRPRAGLPRRRLRPRRAAWLGWKPPRRGPSQRMRTCWRRHAGRERARWATTPRLCRRRGCPRPGEGTAGRGRPSRGCCDIASS